MIKASHILFFVTVGCSTYDDPSRKLESYTYFSDFHAIVFTPDGKSLLTSHPTGDIRLWNFKTKPQDTWGKALADDEIILDTGGVAIAVSPDSKLFAFGRPKGKIQLWRVGLDTKASTLGFHKGDAKAVAFTLDGKTLLTGGSDQVVKVWNLESKTCSDLPHGHAKGIHAIVISPDGKTFATAGDDHIKLWDAVSMKERQVIKREQEFATGFDSIAFSPDSKTLASTCLNEVKLWDALTGKEQATIAISNSQALAFSREGKRFAVSDANAKIFVYDATMRKQIFVLDQGVSPAVSLAFSLDGTILASGHSSVTIKDGAVEGVMQLWNMK